MAVGDKYRALHPRSLDDPEGFWAEQAEAIDWTQALGQGARCLASRRSIAGSPAASSTPATTRSTATSSGGRAEQAALIYDSPVTGTKKSFTYRELRDRVAQLAGAIAAQGVGKGDRVIIYMPMIPEAVMAMLACARLGAVHSVVFGGFAANELATRIDDCTAQAGADGVVRHRARPHRAVQAVARPGDRARRAQGRRSCLVFQRPQADGDDGDGPRPRLERGGGGGRAARLRAGEGDRSALHPLYVGHDRPAQGRGARQWRLLRGARTGR